MSSAVAPSRPSPPSKQSSPDGVPCSRDGCPRLGPTLPRSPSPAERTWSEGTTVARPAVRCSRPPTACISVPSRNCRKGSAIPRWRPTAWSCTCSAASPLRTSSRARSRRSTCAPVPPGSLAGSLRGWRFDPAGRKMIHAGRLPRPVSNAAAVVAGGSAWLLGGEDGSQLATAALLRLATRPASAGHAAPAAAPFQGRLLIADRGNNRLLLVDAAKHVLWRYPSAGAPAPPGGFYFPDDAFFIRHGTALISNEEGNDTIVEIAFPDGRVQWRYGHPKVAGSRPGYLNQPDDAYLLRDGRVVVADAKNCRILLIGPRGTTQIGATGRCAHDPPRSLGYPNGDTPLADGNLLVSEIHGSWIDEITPAGRLVWSVHLPIAYPSDPQQLGRDLYLVADYARPGGIMEFTREGHLRWVYRPRGGAAMLDHPSLAERLPGGLICVNDDYRHRVVVIDPATRRIVWQYGSTDRAGTAPGLLNTPDGFDLLIAGGTTPTHPQTG